MNLFANLNLSVYLADAAQVHYGPEDLLKEAQE